MKCPRCGTENPGRANCCMSCGTPLTAGGPGTVAVAPPVVAAPNRKRTGLIIGSIAAVALIALAVFLFLRARGSQVTEAPAKTGPVGPLAERPIRGPGTAPIMDRPSTPDAPPPQEIIDYLEFLRKIDSQRLALVRQQTAEVLGMSAKLTADRLNAEMGDNPDQAHRESYGQFQQSIAAWAGQWQQLAGAFRAYPKPVPAACGKLADRYNTLLGTTAGDLQRAGNAISTALGGNPQDALNALSSMKGTASAGVDQVCADADNELQSVCDRFKIHKPFDIKPESGGGNPYGIQ